MYACNLRRINKKNFNFKATTKEFVHPLQGKMNFEGVFGLGALPGTWTFFAMHPLTHIFLTNRYAVHLNDTLCRQHETNPCINSNIKISLKFAYRS